MTGSLLDSRLRATASRVYDLGFGSSELDCKWCKKDLDAVEWMYIRTHYAITME